MIYDCYIFRSNQDSIKSIHSTYEDKYITVMFINPKTFTGAKMRRHHNVYCDSNFLDDKEGKKILEMVIKPLASFENSNFVFI